MAAVQNKKTIGLLMAIAIGMFGFAFAMVPLYNWVCEVTGLKNYERAEVSRKIDTSREVLVEFDAIVSDGLPWEFTPMTRKLKVHPGQMYQVDYRATNKTDRAVTGQAVPSVVPWNGAQYFHKIECFCFTEQRLEAKQSRDMPLYFYVDADLPEYISLLRISYTFMKKNRVAAQ